MAISADGTVTSKGQVTIPKRIRDELGLRAGTEVEFTLAEDGTLRVRPKQPAFERLRAVKDQLVEHDIDLEQIRRESKREWSSHLDVNET
ncbi:AbrB/MazE/SpoVT family DNA-binding domain-containing protein [Halorubrum vacuolatum]|uniref:Looped-hinge helix DNA binding domain-containing protein, AbrB family n=1 Tax=Halorubrum vacuolatum TaxID=63740 RepID=A0A238UTZ2_HALVU|nr:AbrB/MazE/SpoVT family DNA-binding domain-containing protein [Halorubrum vacuolatum]SNR24719.1 looped-hinge helix DNA binding domain-containing protein, AbrB family [Halorubrum vacuolatum]